MGRVLAFLVAHHYPAEYDRCYRVGRVHVCARCAGLYPALGLLLALELAGLVGPLRADWAILALLPVPAVVSWARRRVTGASGSNPASTLTGALLGLALGHGLVLYLRDPGSPAFWALVGGLVLAVVLVEVARSLRRRKQ